MSWRIFASLGLQGLPVSLGYDNGAPHSRLPPLGWSSWVGLGRQWPGPEAQAPEFDFCDEASVKLSVDAFHQAMRLMIRS